MTASISSEDEERPPTQGVFSDTPAHPGWTEAAKLAYIIRAADESARRRAAPTRRQAGSWAEAAV